MSINDIITLDNNRDYLILDIVELNKERYLYCAGVDEEEIPTNEYKFMKEIEEEGETFLEEIEDKNVLQTVTAMFTANYVNNYMDDEQDV